jgi:hypothetical protein
MASNDTAQLSLREPEQINWDSFDTGGSKYVAPPPALGPDGSPITYYGVAEISEETNYPEKHPVTGEPVLTFTLDPIKIVKSGPADGQLIRFGRMSTRPFTRKGVDGEVKLLNANSIGNFLRSCGMVNAKPNTNEAYRAAVKSCVGKMFSFTIDWEARNKDTGEKISGYLSFPEDQDRPGTRKSILRQGDVYSVVDRKGAVLEVKRVESEVLFANARLKFFQDPSRGKKQ